MFAAQLLCFCRRLHGYKRFILAALLEHDDAVGKGKQGVVFAHPHVVARVVFGAALPNNDVAGVYFLATKYFDPQSFAFRFATVLYFAFAFLMCHLVLL